MTVEYVERNAVWRGRGRPPRQVPDEVMNMLWRTYNTHTAAVVPVGDNTDKEIRDFRGLLLRGVKNVNLRLRFKVENDHMHFSMVDPLWVRKATDDD